MKKLIASILFFGSFSVAMAQAPSPWGSFLRNAFGNLNLSIGLPFQLAMPTANQSAPVNPVSTTRSITGGSPAGEEMRQIAGANCYGYPSRCSNGSECYADEADISRCKIGDTGVGGGGLGTCSILPGCVGSSANYSCRPLCKIRSIQPLTISGTVSISCPRSIPPISSCNGDPICEQRLKMLFYSNSNQGVADVKAVAAGGKDPYRITGARRFYFDSYPDAFYVISVTDGNNKTATKRIATPAGACRNASRCAAFTSGGELVCRAAQCQWEDTYAPCPTGFACQGGGICRDPDPYQPIACIRTNISCTDDADCHRDAPNTPTCHNFGGAGTGNQLLCTNGSSACGASR